MAYNGIIHYIIYDYGTAKAVVRVKWWKCGVCGCVLWCGAVGVRVGFVVRCSAVRCGGVCLCECSCECSCGVE